MSNSKKLKANEVPEELQDVHMDFGHNVKRNIGNNQRVMVDSFKLGVAITYKNMYTDTRPNWVPIEHCHIFHNKDAKGGDQDKCASIGGHYHEITVKEVNGELVGECSPPIASRSANAVAPHDKHTHPVHYVRSTIVDTKRKVNLEAQKTIGYFSDTRNISSNLGGGNGQS